MNNMSKEVRYTVTATGADADKLDFEGFLGSMPEGMDITYKYINKDVEYFAQSKE